MVRLRGAVPPGAAHRPPPAPASRGRRLLRRRLSPAQMVLVLCAAAALVAGGYFVRAHFVWQGYLRQAERAGQSGQTDADVWAQFAENGAAQDTSATSR